ncbi:MAG: alpha/beta fold hydrolase [Bacteroidetes bacterium]|nr:alpha/beta fold hydrolase [Bacteroidota bacterium]
MTKLAFVLLLTVFGVTCGEPSGNNYFAAHEKGIQSGNVKLVEIESLGKKFNIWTKRFGNNPSVKILLLNGGPGGTHEYFQCFENFLPQEGFEFIYYDQLGCGNSDNPDDTAYWDLNRFVEEVEQVRTALGLTKDNFYLLGHSWGGILAMQYALKYPSNLKGLIISNMMSSCPAYDQYAENVLAKQFDPVVLDSVMAMEARNDFDNPNYMGLLVPNFYEQHILRLPAAQWPDPVNRAFAKLNKSLYVTMQGPSEFGISGRLETWDVSKQLSTIPTPTLVIGAQHDTMDPEHMKWMSTQFKNGSYLYCEKGSHMAMYDDQETYMKGLIDFIHRTK